MHVSKISYLIYRTTKNYIIKSTYMIPYKTTELNLKIK
jgi:hypothetical protein